MKVVQVITALNQGGAQVIVENLAYGLQKEGQEVVVVSLESDHTSTAKRIEDRGIPVLYLDKHSGYDASIVPKLSKTFLALNPDVIHAHNIRKAYVYPAARKAGLKKVVYTVHNMAWKEQRFWGGVVSRILFQKGVMIPVGISPQVTRSIEKRYRLKSVPTVYNGIEFNRFHVKTDYSLSEEPVILNVARLDAQKNHDLLLKAFHIVSKSFPLAKLILVGDGPRRNHIIKKATELGVSDRVLMEGTRDNVPEYLLRADVFCLSSDYEGMPVTLIEAMAAAVPIVATNVGGIQDMLVNEKSALLVEKDEKLLAEAIHRVLYYKELRIQLGLNAYRKSRDFSDQQMARGYIALYEEIKRQP